MPVCLMFLFMNRFTNLLFRLTKNHILAYEIDIFIWYYLEFLFGLRKFLFRPKKANAQPSDFWKHTAFWLEYGSIAVAMLTGFITIFMAFYLPKYKDDVTYI